MIIRLLFDVGVHFVLSVLVEKGQLLAVEHLLYEAGSFLCPYKICVGTHIAIFVLDRLCPCAGVLPAIVFGIEHVLSALPIDDTQAKELMSELMDGHLYGLSHLSHS